jgi:isopenicillin-N epimerase
MQFGRACIAEWPLDPNFLHLNHGTVGGVPRRILQRQRQWQDEIEANPAAFMLRRLVPLVGESKEVLIHAAAARVAAFLGAKHLGFTRNVTSAINAVLRSLAFQKGDEVVVFSDTYGAITIGTKAIVEPQRASVVVAPVNNPHATRDWQAALEQSLNQNTRLVILDHITSGSAAVLNLKPLIAQCHAAGAEVLVDGAHAPGAIAVDIDALGCDYYAGNLHKWMWTPRSCGFLAVRDKHASKIHAPILSWGYGKGFEHEFEWEGTYDPVPMLCTAEALAMFEELSFDRVRNYNHELAWRAYQSLSSLAPQPYSATKESTGTMAAFFLPERFGTSLDDAKRVRDWLWHEHATEVHTYAAHNRVAVRISAQLYIDDDHVAKLRASLA